MIANFDATFIVVVGIVVIVVMVDIAVVHASRVDHAVVTIPALVARAIAMLVDDTSTNHQGS